MHALALVLPAEARRFRVTHPLLATALADAGADLVDDSPDVEISTPEALVGAADVTVILVDAPLDDEPLPLPRRASRRIARSLRARAEAARAARALARRGYGVSILPWDLGHPVHVTPARAASLPRRRLSEWFPQGALVVGNRGTPATSVLEAVLESAAEVVGRAPRVASVSVRAGFLLVHGDSWILRVAIGPTRAQLLGHVSVLDSLRRLPTPCEVASRVPALLGAGRQGIADWTLERRLPGSPPSVPFPAPLLEQCVDYLVALHGIPGSADGADSLAPAAAVVASFAGPKRKPTALALADRLAQTLAGVRRGFVHGDFFPGNLLTEGEQLVGVVDWDAGGSGRFPLTDLLHLRLHLDWEPSDHEWGPAVVSRLLPWAERGGDSLVRRYLLRLGMEPERRVLEALVTTYWLERTAYQLRTHAIRHVQPRWLAANVDEVLGALSRSRLLAPRSGS